MLKFPGYGCDTIIGDSFNSNSHNIPRLQLKILLKTCQNVAVLELF